ncbi:MAG: DNA methyltransferase, partial [Ktedonobacterales bacterium]
VGDETYTLRPLVQKRGVVVLVCDPDARGGIPDDATRKKIDAQATKLHREHLIIYADASKSRQFWQWVKRQPGRPTAYRGETYTSGQSGERLAQRLAQLYVDLLEEESLTLTETAGRVRQAFDVDKVTKRFYDRFQKEHAAFLQAIAGIAAPGDREWYASLMLNRLMFSYFIQKKGFLDGDTAYLRTKLAQMRARFGADQFHTFYREFLLHFFHEGLGAPESSRSPEVRALIGNIPYLNGGLFEQHAIERGNRAITIPDVAFERVFDFFDAYSWHLDERPTGADNEINPDVLGYIFEKYINQKQMGAYYTKEDITGYIGKNTILPFLLEAAKKECKIAFEPEGEVWRLLRDDPDRYIYDAVRKGVDVALPGEIAAGVDDVARRGGWNRPAGAEYALPTETWREHVARRTRCLELRAKLARGEVTEVNDLITYNLDIVRFTQDVIERCEGPELLRALWKALADVTVLDPTCGSGAFLFAALRLLEPLYEACLLRMTAFVADFDREGHPQRGPDFRELLPRVAQHPNRHYFIRKAIILNNLYGVDIMEEAVEIAKLRLFLTLVSQVNDARDLEPLPDIDFNIRAGNTLVGFATYAEAEA